jgi:outer membrane protein assembly factor BamD
MINQYPDSNLLEEAKEKLRAIQEILAESLLGPAKQYYLRRAYPAVVDRCQEILKKYPDFSGTDGCCISLEKRCGRSTRSKVPLLRQIVRDYPLSPLVDDSKKNLLALQASVPDPSPLALDRAKQMPVEGKGVIGVLSMGLFKGGGRRSPKIPRQPRPRIQEANSPSLRDNSEASDSAR